MHASFFFDVTDVGYDRDNIGTELPDIYTAQAEAVRASSDMLRDIGARFWNGPEWMMEVKDDAQRRLFTLRISGTEHGT